MKSEFTVVIPLSVPLTPGRAAALDFVRDRLVAAGWPVTFGVLPADEPWSKGAAVAAGLRRVETPGVIVHDADVIVDDELLQSCALAVIAGHAWAQPHADVYRLSRVGSARVYDGSLRGPHHFVAGQFTERRPHPGPPGGGIAVMHRATYDDVGGIDPGFVGWGGEDISFARALDTLAGPCWRMNGPMWHLWHEPQVILPGHRASAASERLASMYLDAAGNPDEMRRLVDERRSCRPADHR